MDNLTHTLTAVLLSRAGLNRLSPHAAWLLVAGANAADLDVISGLSGQAAYLQYHRGPTHSLVAMPVLALLVTLLVRFFRRRGFSWGKAYLVALIGVASNPLLDLANPYGVRILWPFSSRWVNFDFLAIFDVWIWLLLGAGIAVPWLLHAVSREIGAEAGSGRGMAIFVLCLAILYGGAKFVLHERAVAVLDARMYQGQVPLRVAAMPSAVNPFRWVGLVEGRGFTGMYPGLNLLEDFDPSSGEIHYKPEWTPRSEPFRSFLEFAQWPVWKLTPLPEPEGAVQVELSDLRFGPPGSSRFSVTAPVNPALPQ